MNIRFADKKHTNKACNDNDKTPLFDEERCPAVIVKVVAHESDVFLTDICYNINNISTTSKADRNRSLSDRSAFRLLYNLNL